MSRYGLNRYGLSYYGLGDDYKYLTTYFVAEPVNYGSIQLNWTMPGGSWSELVLVRNTLGYPVDPDDGDTILISTTGDPLNSPDSGLEEGLIYYYSLFVKDTSFGIWHKSGDVSAISVKNFGTDSLMWNSIPAGLRSKARNVLDGSDENEDLRRFIKLIAFEYDYEKTQAYLMTPVSNVNKLSDKFIPVMMAQFGLEYEPSLSFQRARSIIANAAEMYRSKGSLQGLKLFVKSYSGYDCTVSIGKNLMLDYNSSSFEEDPGLWVATNATLEVVDDSTITPYLEPAAPLVYPNRTAGSLKVTSTGGVVTLVCGVDTILDAIPVGASPCTFSVFITADTVSRPVTLYIRWYDRKGVFISESVGDFSLDTAVDWETRPTVTDTPPMDAAFAIPVIKIADTTAGEIHYLDAAQFEESTSATSFEDSRMIKIDLIASRINELHNPNFEVAESPWTFTGIDHSEIVTSTGGHPHNTVSGYALELYPNDVITAARSENITTVLEGNSYAFSIYAQLADYGGTPQTTDLITAKIEWYDPIGELIRIDSGTPLQGMFDEWVRPSVVGTAPAGVGYAIVTVEWTPSSYDMSLLLDTALFEKNAFVDSFFDGTSGFASLSDLTWEGAADNSRSHYYKNLASSLTRLNDLMVEHLVYGSSYQIFYAQP